jgi:predicted RNA binding protein YcfA (HicA-like mRNA interferase family)
MQSAMKKMAVANLFNQRGSHCTYHRADGRLLTIVRPHGKRKTCHPEDVRKILEALQR